MAEPSNSSLHTSCQSETGSEASIFSKLDVVAESPPQPAKDANEIAASKRAMCVFSMFIAEPRFHRLLSECVFKLIKKNHIYFCKRLHLSCVFVSAYK